MESSKWVPWFLSTRPLFFFCPRAPVTLYQLTQNFFHSVHSFFIISFTHFMKLWLFNAYELYDSLSLLNFPSFILYFENWKLTQILFLFSLLNLISNQQFHFILNSGVISFFHLISQIGHQYFPDTLFISRFILNCSSRMFHFKDDFTLIDLIDSFYIWLILTPRKLIDL